MGSCNGSPIFNTKKQQMNKFKIRDEVKFIKNISNRCKIGYTGIIIPNVLSESIAVRLTKTVRGQEGRTVYIDKHSVDEVIKLISYKEDYEIF